MSSIAGRGIAPGICREEINPRSVMIEMRVATESQCCHESVTYTCNFHPDMFGEPVDIARVQDKIQEHAQFCRDFVTSRN